MQLLVLQRHRPGQAHADVVGPIQLQLLLQDVDGRHRCRGREQTRVIKHRGDLHEAPQRFRLHGGPGTDQRFPRHRVVDTGHGGIHCMGKTIEGRRQVEAGRGVRVGHRLIEQREQTVQAQVAIQRTEKRLRLVQAVGHGLQIVGVQQQQPGWPRSAATSRCWALSACSGVSPSITATMPGSRCGNRRSICISAWRHGSCADSMCSVLVSTLR